MGAIVFIAVLYLYAMEEISVKGKKYLKAKLVARELGYTNDYIGQLCRAGKVDAELVGRTWYVDAESIKAHKQTRYRSTKASTRRELQSDVVRAMREEQAVRQEHFYAKHRLRKPTANIEYETDDGELLPEPKKYLHRTELPVELADAEKVDVAVKNEDKYHFEAPKREEIKFFGTLKVTDFITDVPVASEEADAPQKVAVKTSHPHGSAHRHMQSPKAVEQQKEVHITLPSLPDPVVEIPHATDKHHHIPIEVDEEEIKLPFRYHLITMGAFLGGVFVAALSMGFEAVITATSDQVVVAHVFSAENLAALIYLVK